MILNDNRRFHRARAEQTRLLCRAAKTTLEEERFFLHVLWVVTKEKIKYLINSL